MRARIGVMAAAFIAAVGGLASLAAAQVAVKGETVYTMAGEPIKNGVVVVTDGKIAAVGPAASVRVPEGHRVLTAKVVTPGLIDARGTVGVSGILNQRQDQDQLESSSPIQPELRAIDAYNPHDPLVAWVRGFGITTINTGHAPGEVISGQTCIVKTSGNTIDAALVKETGAVAATISPSAQKGGGKSPGTRAKMVAILREELIKARAYAEKRAKKEDAAADGSSDTADGDGEAGKSSSPDRNLRLETLEKVLAGEIPLLVTAHRAQDIDTVLRLQKEFGFRLILDGAAESYLLVDQLKAADVPVFMHPTMMRAFGELENMSVETAATLAEAGIPVAIQSGFESYVPKSRVVLFEAGIAAANGLGIDGALRAITITPAKILGIDSRVGSIEVGKDGDLALYDGDPFEYTTHCTAVVIEGAVVSEEVR